MTFLWEKYFKWSKAKTIDLKIICNRWKGDIICYTQRSRKTTRKIYKKAINRQFIENQIQKAGKHKKMLELSSCQGNAN